MTKENMQSKQHQQEDIEKHKVIAGLSYFNPLLALFSFKKSEFVKFHLNQILTLIIPMIILGIIYGIIIAVATSSATSATPEFSGSVNDIQESAANAASAGQSAANNLMIANIIASLFSIPIAIFGTLNMLSALKGETRRIPIVGKINFIKSSITENTDNDDIDIDMSKAINSIKSNVNVDKIKNSINVDAIKNISIGNFVECNQCGAKIKSGKKFCASCGAPAPVIADMNSKKHINCPKCNTKNEQGYKFCNECGEPAPITEKENFVNCPSCNAKNVENYKFCNECGYKNKQ